MPKKTTKKAAVKEVKQFKITAIFNDQVIELETNDIKETLTSIKPELLNTEVDIKVQKGDQITERHLNLRQGRNLFINESFLDVFISNLMLE